MRLLRTFHPIGQGAFYSEKHKSNSKDFTIVYDCGSTTIKGKKLEKKIKSSFPKDHIIDVLFISHFHADHINGIDILKENFLIKKVVLPFVDDEAKTLLKISNYLNEGYSNTLLIDNPTEYFGSATEVITVSEVNFDSDGDGINIQDPMNISGMAKTQIKSGTALSSGITGHDWLFIPFNYKHDDRKVQFKNSLSILGLSLTDIDTVEKIESHKVKIKKAYNSIDGDLNENSLLLFSGKEGSSPIRCYTHNHQFHFYYHYLEMPSSCIYFGDIDLKQTGIINDINKKLVRLLEIPLKLTPLRHFKLTPMK